MGIHYNIIPVTTGDFTHTLLHKYDVLPEYTKNTRSYTMTYNIPVTTDDFITDTGHCRRLYTRFTQLYVSPRNTLKIHGRVLWHEPVTTDDFITNTGHCRRLYTRLTQLCVSPRNTLKIHGRVLWQEPVTTNDFITNTGHCRRLYTRITQLCVSPQNTLKIHGRVLWHEPVTTDGFINVSHYGWGSGRPASVSDTTTTAVLFPPSGL